MGGAEDRRGRTLKGHKIGLTSRAMQVSSQITEPDYGALLDDMFFNDGSDIPIDRFIVPRVEVELAFVLAKPLRGPNCTLFDVYNATDYVIPRWRLSTRAATTSIPRLSGRAGVRHHLRQRRQRRGGDGRAADQAGCAGSALDLRAAVPQRRD